MRSQRYSLFEIESSPTADQTPAETNDKHGITSEIDLVDLPRVSGYSSGVPPTASTLPGNEANPQSSIVENVTEIRPSTSYPSMNKWRMCSAATMSVCAGLNDASTGTLIPYMEKQYHIGYAVVSLIFVTNALGFILSAPAVHALERRIGRARAYTFGLSLLIIAYTLLVIAPPFPVIVVAFFFSGFGSSINLVLTNVFCANLADDTTALGIYHGMYGIGGVAGPLLTTAMVSHGVRWSFFYFISLGLSVFNVFFTTWAFWKYERDSPQMAHLPIQQDTPETSTRKSLLLKKAIRNRITILGACFIFAYQGAEVSISGWLVTFLMSYRGGNPATVGYVIAGFWGGITIGRFFLSQPARKIGRKMAVFILSIGAVAFQLLVWFVPNIVGDAVAVAIIGILLGPVYTCATSIFNQLLPRDIQISSLGFIGAMGSSGGAAVPFITGLLAQKSGTIVLHPICVGLYVVMEVCWVILPKVRRRTE